MGPDAVEAGAAELLQLSASSAKMEDWSTAMGDHPDTASRRRRAQRQEGKHWARMERQREEDLGLDEGAERARAGAGARAQRRGARVREATPAALSRLHTSGSVRDRARPAHTAPDSLYYQLHTAALGDANACTSLRKSTPHERFERGMMQTATPERRRGLQAALLHKFPMQRNRAFERAKGPWGGALNPSTMG